MAEQKVENIVKSFQSVQFAEMKDKYDVKLEYNSDAGTLSLQFMNKTNIKTYDKTFAKEHIDLITAECKLSAKNLSQVIVDQLTSTDFIDKFCRIFIFSNVKQATTKAQEIATLKHIPDASGIIEGDEGKLNDMHMDKNETKQKLCLLFVLHFAPSKYVQCNYCLIMEEKEISDVDRFMIKYNDVKAENKQLKIELDTTNNQLNQLTQSLNQANNTINTLSQKVDQLESKTVEIDLNLINNWQNFGGSFEVPKSFKIGSFVYLQGLVKSGNVNTTIAVLPEGFRPKKTKIFGQAQNSNQACRVDISANGKIYLNGNFPAGWVSLDGIQFVVTN